MCSCIVFESNFEMLCLSISIFLLLNLTPFHLFDQFSCWLLFKFGLFSADQLVL